MPAPRLQWGKPLLNLVIFVVGFVNGDSFVVVQSDKFSVVAICLVPAVDIAETKGWHICYSLHDAFY